MSEPAVPRLDLAPRLRRPLSLWNPLDYLRLLYWVFFFPQAIRWYIETFGDPDHQGATGGEAVRKALRLDLVQRRLVIQGLLNLILASIVLSLVLKSLDISLGWPGLVLGIAGGMFAGLVQTIVSGVAGGVRGGMAIGVVFGVTWGMVWNVNEAAARNLILGIGLGIGANFTISVDSEVFRQVSYRAAFILSLSVAIAAILGVPIGVAAVLSEASENLMGLAVFGVSVVASSIISFGRLADWIILFPVAFFKGVRLWSRTIWLPLPSVQGRLESSLHRDWATGIHDVNEILQFSLQSIPAVKAINSALDDTSEDMLLSRIVELSRDPIDWDLLRFSSADFSRSIRLELAKTIIWLPKAWRDHWENRYLTVLRFNTPSRCACAGFWLWHNEEAEQAAGAFNRFLDIPFGQELSSAARAIADTVRVQALSDFESWKDDTAWLDTLPEARLRPGTLETLSVLRTVATEASVAQHAHAPLNRSAALARAADLVKQLLDTGAETCAHPEWPLIRDAAERWRDIIIHAGGEAGREILREPIDNPYKGYSGLPVTGPNFVGRRGALREIETRWSTSEPPAIILYGHRRMGKTSILRNLEQSLRPDNLLVYLDMQDAAVLVDHTGQVLLDFAEAIHTRATAADLDLGEPPAEDDYQDLGRARRALNALLTRLTPQIEEGRLLILAIDEFEVIEDGIQKGRIDPGLLPYLRSVNQRHSWLALIFAGLHTLDEMGRDYKNAFWGQTEHVRVGYLKQDDALDLIRRPHPDFALEYSDALAHEIYRLTYGQPYLLQRLCWELVRRWNERFLKEGESTPRVLELQNLEPVLDDELYAAAEYYFDGVWKNVTDAEQALMIQMAERQTPWTRGELSAPETLELLARHDVVLEAETGVAFASELMRRWVADYRPTS